MRTNTHTERTDDDTDNEPGLLEVLLPVVLMLGLTIGPPILWLYHAWGEPLWAVHTVTQTWSGPFGMQAVTYTVTKPYGFLVNGIGPALAWLLAVWTSFKMLIMGPF